MDSFRGELLAFDRQRVNVRAGVVGLLVLSVLGVAMAIWGAIALAATIGALVLLVTDPPPAGRSWAAAVLPLVIGGSVLTFVAVLVGGRPLPAAMLVGLVGVVVTIQSGRSEKAGIRGLIASIWVILALTLNDTPAVAVSYSVAFAGGAIVGAAVAWFTSRAGSAEGTGSDEVSVPVGQFAVLRGLGLAAATFIGFTYFPEHPAWVSITVVIVVRPPTRKAVVVGLQRSLGTGLGVIFAVLVTNVVGENRPGLIVLFLASAFLAMAFREVNYALFAMFVTALVVYSQRILGADAAESGQARLVETVLGVIIAFIVLGLTQLIARRQNTEA